jgi:DNA-binding CsgD family transcriptional regulator
MLEVMAPRVSSARFVGRSAELSELETALADAARGCPSVVLVGGDSGVGKSRLVTELADGASDARVMIGDCVELGEGELPYAPIIAALRPLGRDGDPALSSLPDTVRAELARLLPSLGPAAVNGAGDDGLAQTRLFEALLGLLHALGTRAPVLFVLEDIHWADRSTRAFLAFLARSLYDERIVVVTTYRVDELHRRHPLRPLLADLEANAKNVRAVSVGPLSEDEIHSVLEDILGEPPEPELVRRLHARSEGNPLYMEELLAARRDGRGAAPRSLRDALMVRVERMSAPAQDVLRVLAVGRSLDHALITETSGLEDGALRDALREVTASQLVVTDEDGGHAFRHALLREVAYDDMLPGERVALQRRIAEALERRAEAHGLDAQLASAIAYHRLEACDEQKALGASVRAAHEAEDVGAHGEAAALLERALELWERVPDPEAHAAVDHVTLLARTAHQHQLDGHEQRQDSLLRQALAEVDETVEPRRAASLLGQLSRAQWSANRSEDAFESIARGLDLVPAEEPVAERGALLAWWARARMLQGKFASTIRAALEARDIAEAVGDEELRGRALNPLGVALMATGDIEEGAEALREALRIARERRNLPDIGSAGVNLADRLHLAGRSREGLVVARDLLAELSDSRYSRVWVSLLIADICFDLGEWDESAALVAGLDRYVVSPSTTQLNLGLRRAELALGRGAHAEAAVILEDLRELVEESTEPQFLAPFGVLLAALRRRSGDLDGAAAATEETIDRLEFCTEDAMRLSRISVAGVAVEADRAEQARDVGDDDAEALAIRRAEIMVSRAEAAADGGGPVEIAWHLSSLADLARARGDGDPAPWAAAARMWETIERVPQVAYNRWREAEAHAARGDAAAAGEAARAALAISRRLGATWLTAELESLAARARFTIGATAPAAPAAPAAEADPFGLTPRERQVLALVAEGSTNREVGERLFMAEKTASVHVSRILRKLGVSSRTQAAAVAHRFGMED